MLQVIQARERDRQERKKEPWKMIFDYMAARAEMEGVEHSLPRDFYHISHERGVRTFFGVTLDDDGNLLEDVQQPAFFLEYQAQREEENANN
jgi:hypothetical protein